jgi:RNA polymerase sigma-70 factor (ECF subfamily)
MDTSLDIADVLEAGVDALDDVRSLYAEHASGLASALRRLTWSGADYEDLLQEVFIIAVRRRAQLRAAASKKAWLYNVALKVAATARRGHRVRAFLGLGPAPRRPTDAQLESLQVVHVALSRLAPKKREVLVLFELEGFSGPEISETLRIPLKTVWTRLHHARKEFEKWVTHE